LIFPAVAVVGHALGFGIGIAVGYATLGQIGFGRRLEYAAVGSVTNLASRLCDEAAGGQIIVSQRVFGMVGPWVDAASIGAVTLKGFNRPIPALEILAWRDEPKELRHPRPACRSAAPPCSDGHRRGWRFFPDVLCAERDSLLLTEGPFASSSDKLR
jgi:hypothetical protein